MNTTVKRRSVEEDLQRLRRIWERTHNQNLKMVQEIKNNIKIRIEK